MTALEIAVKALEEISAGNKVLLRMFEDPAHRATIKANISIADKAIATINRGPAAQAALDMSEIIGCNPPAPPCIYCGSTSECDQSIPHPPKHGQGAT